jgi:carbon-monoxide dehydrogenase medium subunit
MIPATFEYVRATSVEDAVAQLANFGDEARVIAGGQSLIPFMRLRFATPTALVDISELRDLSYVRHDAGRLKVGALTRHSDLNESQVVATHLPLLARMAGQLGDTQVRNRGTIGGAVAHADPAGEYAALCLMLDADIVTTRRSIPAREFFLGRYTTPLDYNEILLEISFPAVSDGESYIKFGRKLYDWALVGAAVQLMDGGVRVGLVNVADTPIRCVTAEQAFAAGSTPDEAGLRAADGLRPTPSQRASTEYKVHLIQVLTSRAIRQAQASV